MPAATLLCINTFIYRYQSVIHGRYDNSAFGQNTELFRLKAKVKKSLQLKKHYLYDIGRWEQAFTTRSGGGGGGGVDSSIERDDKLRKLTKAILWTLTNTFVIPYMAIRLNKADSVNPPIVTSQLVPS